MTLFLLLCVVKELEDIFFVFLSSFSVNGLLAFYHECGRSLIGYLPRDHEVLMVPCYLLTSYSVVDSEFSCSVQEKL